MRGRDASPLTRVCLVAESSATSAVLDTRRSRERRAVLQVKEPGPAHGGMGREEHPCGRQQSLLGAEGRRLRAPHVCWAGEALPSAEGRVGNPEWGKEMALEGKLNL